MLNLLFGKKKSSPISITVLGAYLQDNTCYEFVLIKCSHHGKGVYLYNGGEMVEKELQKAPFSLKMSGHLQKNPVSLLLQGGKPRELDLVEAIQVIESLQGFTPILAFYNLKKELFEGAKKAPKAKPEKAPSPAIEVEAKTVE